MLHARTFGGKVLYSGGRGSLSSPGRVVPVIFMELSIAPCCFRPAAESLPAMAILVFRLFYITILDRHITGIVRAMDIADRIGGHDKAFLAILPPGAN